MSTTKKDEAEEPKPKAKTALEKLRASAFNSDKEKGPVGEWIGLRWKQPEEGTKFQVQGAQGVLVDEQDKPVVLDASEGNQFLQEITQARPGDGVRLVPVN